MVIGATSKFQELEPNTLLSDLISHIEKELPLFISSQSFKKIMLKKQNENQHSTAFNIFMMKKQDKFSFLNEVAQKGSHKIDIAIFDKSTDDIIFTIEAKILPTPIINDKNRSESEYVFSPPGFTGAGIERFKDGNHGLDCHEIPLKENGMIAYIKENDFKYWSKQVNQWISDAKWGKKENLKKIYFKAIGKLKSTHIRKDKSQFTMHHFWVYVPLVPKKNNKTT